MRPEMVYVKTSKLKLNPNNPRNNKESVPVVMKAIEKYGFKVPLVCNTDYVVYCGNTRLKAARKLGLEELPCIFADDLTPEEIREFAIVDNKSSEIAEWESKQLAAELEELEGLKEFGFEFDCLENLINKNNINSNVVVEDDVPQVNDEEPTIAQKGDVWILGRHKLLCGDCLDEASISNLLGENKVDLLLTDPPYNVDYVGKTKQAMKIENDNQSEAQFKDFLFKAFSICHKIMKEGAAFYIWFASRNHIAFEEALLKAQLPTREELIWAKNAFVLGRQDYQWRHEPCLYGWKEGAPHKWYNDRSQTTVMEYARTKVNEDHPTMKPVGLFDYLIRNSSQEQEIVFDGFAGSGTTLIACEQNNRTCYSVEIYPKYCDVIIKRYINLVKSNKEVFVIRDNKKISYSKLVK